MILHEMTFLSPYKLLAFLFLSCSFLLRFSWSPQVLLYTLVFLKINLSSVSFFYYISISVLLSLRGTLWYISDNYTLCTSCDIQTYQHVQGICYLSVYPMWPCSSFILCLNFLTIYIYICVYKNHDVHSSMSPIHWSSCSLEYLALAFEHGMDYCLRNRPEKYVIR